MANTTASAWSAAIQTSVQSKVLRNLRDEMVWANESWAEQGTFEQGTDQIMFLTYPDLSITTPLTPLTEGTPPTARVITMTNTTIVASQYGDLVSLTDVAKRKSPVADVVSIATERVTRVSKQVIDRVTRDAIFTGGTPFYGGDATTRATIGTNDQLTGAALIKLRARMVKLNIPRFSDQLYRLYIHPNQAYDLKSDSTDDTGWLDSRKYDKAEDILNGQIGVLHGFRIAEINTAPTFASTQTVHAGIAVGDLKGWGVGDLMTLETYHVAGVDFGNPLNQLEQMGWKIYFGAGPLNNGYYVRVESYATDA